VAFVVTIRGGTVVPPSSSLARPAEILVWHGVPMLDLWPCPWNFMRPLLHLEARFHCLHCSQYE